jgi:hypothetical protein
VQLSDLNIEITLPPDFTASNFTASKMHFVYLTIEIASPPQQPNLTTAAKKLHHLKHL